MCRDGMSCHLQYCCQIFMYVDIILEQPDFHAVFPSNQEEFLKSSFTLYQRFDIHVNEKTTLRQWSCLADHVMKRASPRCYSILVTIQDFSPPQAARPFMEKNHAKDKYR